jgi:hypothetical protein
MSLSNIIEYLRKFEIKIYSYMPLTHLNKLVKHHKKYNFEKYPKCMKDYIIDIEDKYEWKLHELKTYIFKCVTWSSGYIFLTNEKKNNIERMITWTQDYTNIPIQTCNWIVRVIYKCSRNKKCKYIYELYQYTDLVKNYETNYFLEMFFVNKTWIKIFLFYLELLMDIYSEHDTFKDWVLSNNMKNTFKINDKIYLHPLTHLCFVSHFVK